MEYWIWIKNWYSYFSWQLFYSMVYAETRQKVSKLFNLFWVKFTVDRKGFFFQWTMQGLLLSGHLRSEQLLDDVRYEQW